MLQRRALLFVPLMLCATRARAQTYRAHSIEVRRPWARPTAARLGTAYLTLSVEGVNLDRLTAAETPVAERVELRNEAGEPVWAIEVPPGELTTLAPGKSYLGLVALRRPLSEGEQFPLTLEFEVAGTLEVPVEVRQAPPR